MLLIGYCLVFGYIGCRAIRGRIRYGNFQTHLAQRSEVAGRIGATMTAPLVAKSKLCVFRNEIYLLFSENREKIGRKILTFLRLNNGYKTPLFR